MTDNQAFQIPYDLLNEQVVIAAALVSGDARKVLIGRVRPDQFHDDAHSEIWTVLERATAQSLVPNPATLVHMSGGKLDIAYLEDLIAAHPTAPPNLSYNLGSLQWDNVRARAVQGPIAELLRALQNPGTPSERVRALAGQVSVAFSGVGRRGFLRDAKKLVREQVGVVRDRITGIACYPYGIDGLDFYREYDLDESRRSLKGMPLLVPGAAPGKITTITAISGGGKSTVTALAVLGIARQGRSVLYGPWEMGAGETLELLGCISAQLPRSRARAGKLTPAEVMLLEERMHAISQVVRFVEMPFGKTRGARATHQEVLDEIHGYIADSGCEVAVFDLWRRAFAKMKDEADEAEALYRQQAIAEETQTHVILVQQQRLKDIEKRVNPIPSRDGIKGSSAWVDVSDTVLGIYLPNLMKQASCNVIEVLVLKQRFGRWPLRLEFQWDADVVKMNNGKIVAFHTGVEGEASSGHVTVSKGAADFMKGVVHGQPGTKRKR